ncbi:MAG: hypothetical protein K0R94_293, partial [Burkholderiales bacterium]|nr:hypothetical protein [Burkholderiales bacterium]
ELNLKYCPEKALIDQDTSITLFKALKSPINDGDNSLNAIVDYYTFGRNNNGLDEVLTNKFNLVPINSTHFGWIEDKMSVELIGKYINRSISIS